MGQRSQDPNFVLGIPAIYVQRRFGLRIALDLRFLQDVGEFRLFQFHTGKDVITSAVDDAVKMGDAIADEAFAERFDDRYAATYARLVIEIGPIFPGSCEQFLAMGRKEGFV